MVGFGTFLEIERFIQNWFTVGSGIFVSPAIALRGTGSVGISLLLWGIGAIAGISGLLVWLELGLSLPKYRWDELPDRDPNEPRQANEKQFECVPRSGGEKNYVCVNSRKLKISVANTK